MKAPRNAAHRRARELEAERVVGSVIVAGLLVTALGLVVAYGLATSTGLFDRGLP